MISARDLWRSLLASVRGADTVQRAEDPAPLTSGPIVEPALELELQAPAAVAGAMPALSEADIADIEACTRERLRAITTHPEAQGRARLAQYLAFDTDMPAEQAIAALAAAAKTRKPTGLERFMARAAPRSQAQGSGQGGDDETLH